MNTALLPTFEQTASEVLADIEESIHRMTLEQIEARAISLLQEFEPDEGYYLCFSGGKDSVVIKELAKRAGVKFDDHYNQTTIDPPELIQFIRQHHPETPWNRPKMNMMHRVATRPGTAPTRAGRWCCEEYKEGGGDGRFLIIGTRAAESPRRKKNWKEIAEDIRGNRAICPIVYWTDSQLWGYIKLRSVPYCKLYDEGIKRIGCIDCPLQNPKARAKERARWPIIANNWKRALIKNWENFKDVPNKKGEPRYQSKFDSGEQYYQWWISEMSPDALREECNSGVLFTNHELNEP